MISFILFWQDFAEKQIEKSVKLQMKREQTTALTFCLFKMASLS